MRLDIYDEVERLKRMGLKVNFSSLGKTMGCDPRTAKKYFSGQTSSSRKKAVKISKLSDFTAIIEDKVDTCSATAMAIYEFIKTKGYEGKYGLVKKYIRNHKKTQFKKATMRFETTPGLQGQVDWKEKKKMISKHGEIFEINIFLYILGYSRFKYMELTFDRKQETLLKCMDHAFAYSNGIPKEILFDNMSTVVDQHQTHVGHVIYNAKFKQFSKDYGFEPIACRPYRPQTKGKVEALAKLTNRLDVYNYEFENEKDLEHIVKTVNQNINHEISQAINDTPINRLKKEQEHLDPIPSRHIRDSYFTRQRKYSVSKESMITYKGNKYSVPTYYIGKQVEIQLFPNEIQIYYNTDQIATHILTERFLNYKTDHLREILQSDALRHRNIEDIDDFINNNLQKMDMLMT